MISIVISQEWYNIEKLNLQVPFKVTCLIYLLLLLSLKRFTYHVCNVIMRKSTQRINTHKMYLIQSVPINERRIRYISFKTVNKLVQGLSETYFYYRRVL